MGFGSRRRPTASPRFRPADVVNNCNLRCPFCLVDHSNVKKTGVMSETTFRNLMRLVASVPDGHFYLS
jgi:sulfatase maturation enzyme AslB (radical SAM superfamily)